MKYLQFLSLFPRKLKKYQVSICEQVARHFWVGKLKLPNNGFSGHRNFNQSPFCVQYRGFCQEPDKPNKLNLAEFPLITWPNIIKSIKNWIYTTLIIRPYLDPEFNLTKFVEGSKLAATVVSSRLATGNFQELEGLVTPDCLRELQKNISVLNAKQRQELEVVEGDIYFSFPYELGILFDDAQSTSGTAQKRYVEITMVHHVLRGHKEMIDRGDPIPLNIGVMPEFREKLFILNYRYIRDYTKGVSDQWTLNIVNHFKPGEFEPNR